MYDRFMVPYYFYWPIALISFILVFFLPTNTKVILKEEYDQNITNYTNNNLSDLYLLNSQNEKNITWTCRKFLNDINNQHEIYSNNKLNLTIKIIIFILFGFSVLNIGLVILMVKGGCCYDDDIGGFCQTWEQTFSFNPYVDDDIEPYGFWVFSIFIVICLGIIILCALSLYFSLQVKDKITLFCNLELDKDYNIDLYIVSKVFLGIIIFLYFVEILLCFYSIFFAIFQIKKGKINKNYIDSNSNSKTGVINNK